jgi:hypothetical protein
MNDPGAPPEQQLGDPLVLAAVRRAALHRAGAGEGAPLADIAAHLGVRRRSRQAATLRAALTKLEQRGLLTSARAHGIALWRASPRGSRRLDEALAEGDPPRLPESPQHLAWRRARTASRVEIGRLGADLRDSLARCERLLSGLEGPPARAGDSDDWFALADRLRHDCRRVGSAWHCLREWPEPDDERADIDDLSAPPATGGGARKRESAGEHGERAASIRARRAGRRNVRLWNDRA